MLKSETIKATAIDGVITCSREFLSGTPVFKNTRVPVKNLIDYLEAGDSLNEFLNDFPSVKREQAIQALEAAKEMLLEGVKTQQRR
ncbi:MAG: DUF433 domain-containing protein [Candidatus Thiosymbion ectosymbiont of Robbea hypermnestra]|nr:DUF433 domain-containing protein [Candidatus Thiosymbion ectosymbiont of Robbea hypermnestra]